MRGALLLVFVGASIMGQDMAPETPAVPLEMRIAYLQSWSRLKAYGEAFQQSLTSEQKRLIEKQSEAQTEVLKQLAEVRGACGPHALFDDGALRDRGEFVCVEESKSEKEKQ